MVINVPIPVNNTYVIFVVLCKYFLKDFIKCLGPSSGISQPGYCRKVFVNLNSI